MRVRYYIKWLWKASVHSRLRILAAGLINILRVAISLFIIWISKMLVDIATGHDEGSIWCYVILMALGLGCQSALSAIGGKISTDTDIRFRNRLRNYLFSRVMESKWSGRESMHTGDITNRIEEDVRVISGTVCRTAPAMLSTAVQLVAAMAMLASMDSRLMWIVALIMPVALAVSKSYMKRLRDLTRGIRDTDSRIQAHIQENIQHRTVISTLERTSDSIDTLSHLQTDLRDQVKSRTDYSVFSRTIVQAGFSAGYLTVFTWCIFGLKDGSITFGLMTAFLQLVSQIQRPVVELSRQVPSFIHATASIDRIADISGLPPEAQGQPVRIEGRTGIRMEDVTYAYPDGGRNILEGFSHDFRPGSFTAVIGETGSGKSTLVRLLLGLLTPDRGRITLYGRSGSAEASPLTRCNITYVPQGNTLISGSIRENLLLGNPGATEAQLNEALHTAVADFVFSLPEGLDFRCGETGAGLSEGQAQRIAIARGLLHQGNVLILDEPTSALDRHTGKELMDRLLECSRGKTIIIVTHRNDVSGEYTDIVKIRG